MKQQEANEPALCEAYHNRRSGICLEPRTRAQTCGRCAMKWQPWRRTYYSGPRRDEERPEVEGQGATWTPWRHSQAL